MSGDTSYNNDEFSNINFPNTNDPEITVITPENITYNGPMNGYYPATYGFENDLDGTVPQEWFLGIATGGTAQVVSELGGRKKVVQVVDTVANGYPYLLQTFTSRTTGIVEFYIRKESGSTQAGFELRSVGDIATGIRIDYNNNGKFEAYQGAGYLEIAAGDYSDQTWFHIKVAFDTSTDTADFYVNGVLEASSVAFKNDVASIDRIYFGPNYAYTGSFYFDAVGYSWDSDYNIGDNINEGLLLSYDNTTTLDWIGYSLNGAVNKTIIGNTTIPLPEDGNHNIQVFGNKSLGAIYESGIRYFAVGNYIEIITPENITYTEPMSGYYPATYGFENDLMGTNPQNWGTNEDSSTSIQVEEVFNDHKNVLSFIDQSSGGNCESWRDVGAQTSGYVEYWVAVEDVATLKMVTLTLRNGGVYGTVVFGLTIRTDYINPWGSASHICDLVAEQWFHIKLRFNCSSDQGDIYVNGVYNSTFPFVNNVDDIDCLRIETGWGDFSAENVYFDAFGASWDPNYNVGDNLIEGLLLSYDTTTTLDWQGYSLNGTANKTILGNTTIPMPDEGGHNIQVFGNDSLGTMYDSDIRYFSVDTLDPVITINSPLTGEIFTDLPPQFNLTIDEVNLDTTWYTLDGGATSIDFTELTGYIDSTAWNNAPIGAVTIRFYARDKAGNEVYQEVIVIKSSGQQEPPEIPGFNIALLCLTIVVITTSLLKIKKSKIK